MIDELLSAFDQATSERDKQRILLDAEALLTPIEVVELAARTPERIRRRFARLSAGLRWIHPAPRQYLRQNLHRGIDRYSGPGFSRSGKRLILGFTGFGRRLMMPLSLMLQFLSEDDFDLVLLADWSRGHFMNGIDGHSHSLHELLTGLSDELRLKDYARVFCYGTSGGGLAALRGALLLRAHRGIAIGPRFPWHIHRLRSANEIAIPPFDPLCACFAGTRIDLVCAFAGDNAVDARAAKRTAAILPVQQIVFPGFADHNLIVQLFQSGMLGSFFDRIFTTDAKADLRPSPAARIRA